MKKYTNEQKLAALRSFEDGFTAKEIFEVLGIPEGTLYRWKSEGLRSPDPKSERSSSKSSITFEDSSSEDLRRELAEAKAEIEDLRRTLDEILPFVRRQIKADNKRREESEQTSTFKFKHAGSI